MSEGSKVLSRDAMIAAASSERQTEFVEVPSLGGGVYVRELSGAEMDDYQASLMRQKGDQFVPDYRNKTAKLVARCVVDEAGERLFADKEVEEVGKMPNHILQPLSMAAQRVNGMDLGEQESMEGNSETAAADSTSP